MKQDTKIIQVILHWISKMHFEAVIFYYSAVTRIGLYLPVIISIDFEFYFHGCKKVTIGASFAKLTNGRTCKTFVPVALRILIDSLSLSFLANGAICHSSAAALLIWFSISLLDHYQLCSFTLHLKSLHSLVLHYNDWNCNEWRMSLPFVGTSYSSRFQVLACFNFNHW